MVQVPDSGLKSHTEHMCSCTQNPERMEKVLWHGHLPGGWFLTFPPSLSPASTHIPMAKTLKMKKEKSPNAQEVPRVLILWHEPRTKTKYISYYTTTSLSASGLASYAWYFHTTATVILFLSKWDYVTLPTFLLWFLTLPTVKARHLTKALRHPSRTSLLPYFHDFSDPSSIILPLTYSNAALLFPSQ